MSSFAFVTTSFTAASSFCGAVIPTQAACTQSKLARFNLHRSQRCSPSHITIRAQGVDASENKGEYVYRSLVKDPRTGVEIELSLKDQENLFLDALNSYYAGKPLITDEEFDQIKEELTWQGSKVVLLSKDELIFLEAAKEFARGKPIMSDTEFDALKAKLKATGSTVSLLQGPRCSLISQTCWSDCAEDNQRLSVLYLPAAGIMALVWAFISFEFTPLRNYNPLISLLCGLPAIALLAKVFTELVLPSPQILAGDCPNCGKLNRVYFGDIATVEGYKGTAEITCNNCKAYLSVNQKEKRLTLLSMSSPKKAPPKKAPAKKKPAADEDDAADE